MEIIYLYIHSYRHLQNMEINFSPQYKLKLYADGILQVTENTHIPEDFFSSSINSIHGIVGKNGFGKSTILEILSGSFHSEASFFIVMKEGNEFFISMNNYNVKIQIKDASKNSLRQRIVPIINKERNKVKRKKVRTQTMYLHSKLGVTHFSTKFNKKYGNVYGIDVLSANLNKLSATILKNEQNIDLILGNMLKHSLNPQIDFTVEFDKEKLIQRNPRSKVFIEDWLPKVPYNLKEKMYFYVLISELEQSLKKGDASLLDDISYSESFIPSQFVKKSAIYANHQLIFPKFFNLIELENKEQINKKTKYFNAEHILRVPDDIRFFVPYFRVLLDQLKHFKLPFTFKISNLSQGESALYHFITRLNDTLEYLERNRIQNGVWLIDEIEAFLHPEWCRSLINIIIEFINRYNNLQPIQVILSTHSPYILSDLPRECITKLNRKSHNEKIKVVEDTKETFAANINDLLAQAFFMDETIGEFAKNKITNVVDMINKGHLRAENQFTIQFVISIIGDPIIRKIIQQQYAQMLEKINPKQAAEEKIKLLQNEIKILRESFKEKV